MEAVIEVNLSKDRGKGWEFILSQKEISSEDLGKMGPCKEQAATILLTRKVMRERSRKESNMVLAPTFITMATTTKACGAKI